MDSIEPPFLPGPQLNDVRSEGAACHAQLAGAIRAAEAEALVAAQLAGAPRAEAVPPWAAADAVQAAAGTRPGDAPHAAAAPHAAEAALPAVQVAAGTRPGDVPHAAAVPHAVEAALSAARAAAGTQREAAIRRAAAK